MSAALPPIAPEALTWRFTRSGGPGGQHVNTSSTRVEVVCDLAAAGFAPDITARLIAKLGDVVTVSASDTRSQRRNRELALARLHEQLAAAAVVPRRRTATRPGRGAVERRLAGKREQSQRKAGRAWRPDE